MFVLNYLIFYSMNTLPIYVHNIAYKSYDVSLCQNRTFFFVQQNEQMTLDNKSTKQQEAQNLSDIFDLELWQNELLKNKKYGIHINHKTNDITKINDNQYVQMYGENKFGNMKVLNNNNNNTECILNVILKAQIKQSTFGNIYIGVTESNFNVCKNNDEIEESKGIYFSYFCVCLCFNCVCVCICV